MRQAITGGLAVAGSQTALIAGGVGIAGATVGSNALAKVTPVSATQAAAPAVVKSIKPTVFRFQSTWSSRDIFNEFAQDFAKKVNDMTGGQLRIEVYPANSIVKVFGLQNAVHKGVLDGGHGVPTYWHDRNPAFSLFGSGPSFGMSSNHFLAWYNYGGGVQLYEELIEREMKLNLRGFLYGPLAPQPLGWFKNRIASIKDLQGLKFRAVGLAAEVYNELGLKTSPLSAAEVVPWMDKGLIDAGEFNNPSSDRGLGFPTVSNTCMVRSFHQSAEVFEVIFNKDRFDSLPFELRSIIRYALQASSADLSWKASDRFSSDFDVMKKQMGIKFLPTPDEILKAQLVAWQKIVARYSASSPIFRRIIESQMRFAKRVVGFENDYFPPSRMAYDFWFTS